MDTILEANNLRKYFLHPTGFFPRKAVWVRAVDGVSFGLARGQTLGLVGESGCGKTTLGRLLLRLLEPNAGEVLFEGINIFNLKREQLRSLRRDIQIIFQDPVDSLNPRMKIGEIIEEPLAVHNWGDKKQRRERVKELLNAVGLDATSFHRYPRQFSGGQRQRVGIARALATRPKLIICDEPVSSLDLSVQAQVLNLLMDLQERNQLTYLFITHNLRVVAAVSERIMVMYLGKIVEIAPTQELYTSPLHPYTRALLRAVMSEKADLKSKNRILKGDISSGLSPPSGCRFHPRCPIAKVLCSESEPPLVEVEPGHLLACHFPYE